MSLLDDARRMSGVGPYFKRGDEAMCWWCRETVIANEPHHAPDCPWLSMPKIVATLEAAERVTVAYNQVTLYSHTLHPVGQPDSDSCTRCIGEADLPLRIGALVVALWGRTP